MDRNKAKGMLWGLIVGDAFGSPIQFTLKDNHHTLIKSFLDTVEAK